MCSPGGRPKRVGHCAGGLVMLYARVFPFFTTSYGRPVQPPAKISFALCKAAKTPTGTLLGVPSGRKCVGDASSKSGMFIGAGLLSALNAISSGCHGL